MNSPKHISKSEFPDELLSSKVEGKQLRSYDFQKFVCINFNEESFHSFVKVWETRKKLAKEEHQSLELVEKAEEVLKFLANKRKLKLSHWINSDLRLSFLYSEDSKEVLFL